MAPGAQVVEFEGDTGDATLNAMATCVGLTPVFNSTVPNDGGVELSATCVQVPLGQAGPIGANDSPLASQLSMSYAGCDGNPAALPVAGKPLAAGQKVSYLNVTCVVGTDNLLACLDTTSGDHGFVLQRSGSWAF